MDLEEDEDGEDDEDLTTYRLIGNGTVVSESHEISTSAAVQHFSDFAAVKKLNWTEEALCKEEIFPRIRWLSD